MRCFTAAAARGPVSEDVVLGLCSMTSKQKRSCLWHLLCNVARFTSLMCLKYMFHAYFRDHIIRKAWNQDKRWCQLLPNIHSTGRPAAFMLKTKHQHSQCNRLKQLRGTVRVCAAHAGGALCATLFFGDVFRNSKFGPVASSCRSATRHHTLLYSQYVSSRNAVVPQSALECRNPA